MSRITIGKKRWELIFVPLRQADGECDPPETAHKQIRIRRGLLRHPRRLLEVVLHEAIHAGDFRFDEPWVEQVAEDLARILWGMGFRLIDPLEKNAALRPAVSRHATHRLATQRLLDKKVP